MARRARLDLTTPSLLGLPLAWLAVFFVVLYALMFALPLVGWGMLSAARYPIILYGPLELPPILPHDAVLYAVLRTAHTVLALLLFATFIAHFSAALMHALIYRDGVFPSMASWKSLAGIRCRSER